MTKNKNNEICLIKLKVHIPQLNICMYVVILSRNRCSKN